MNAKELEQEYKDIIETLPYDADIKNILKEYKIFFAKVNCNEQIYIRWGSGATVNFRHKTIAVNIRLSEDQIDGVIRHEIAHVVTFCKIGYHIHRNPTFLKTLKECRGTRFCNGTINRRPFKYYWYCEKCGQLLWKVKQKPSKKDIWRHSFKTHKNCGGRIAFNKLPPPLEVKNEN